MAKTTLLSQLAWQTSVPVTWLSLDDDDNDPIHFLQYLIAALQKIVPTVRPDLMGVLRDTQAASSDLWEWG